MTLFSLTLKRLFLQKGQNLLLIFLIAFSACLIFTISTVSQTIEQKLFKDVGQVDAVIGAKGSPLQLILSSIHHIDIPTGNIAYTDYLNIKRNRSLKTVVPISLGDQYHGFHIVGTEKSYLKLYQLSLTEGSIFTHPMQAVIGAQAAQETGLKIGDTFVGTHGLFEDPDHKGHVHKHFPYKVVGILAPTGGTNDRLILTSLDSVWLIHGHHDHHEDGDDEDHDTHNHETHEDHDAHNHETHEDHDAHNHEMHEQHSDDHQAQLLAHIPEHAEVTALLVKYRTKLAALNFPREINRKTPYQAAAPAYEMARLTALIGFGKKTLLVIVGFLFFATFMSLCLNLIQSVENRQYELAVYRSLGASRRKIATLILLEAFILSLIGLFIGAGLTEVVFGIFSNGGTGLASATTSLSLYSLTTAKISVGVILACLIAATIPAYKAYKVDIWSTLHK